jgi:phage tail tape-measure protein
MIGQGYGVGASLNSLGRNAGGGLAGAAEAREQQGMQMLGDVAAQETQRNIANTQARAQAKAGNMQLGATLGAAIGSVVPGVGTLIGGVLGGLAGGLF